MSLADTPNLRFELILTETIKIDLTTWKFQWTNRVKTRLAKDIASSTLGMFSMSMIFSMIKRVIIGQNMLVIRSLRSTTPINNLLYLQKKRWRASLTVLLNIKLQSKRGPNFKRFWMNIRSTFRLKGFLQCSPLRDHPMIEKESVVDRRTLTKAKLLVIWAT